MCHVWLWVYYVYSSKENSDENQFVLLIICRPIYHTDRPTYQSERTKWLQTYSIQRVGFWNNVCMCNNVSFFLVLYYKSVSGSSLDNPRFSSVHRNVKWHTMVESQFPCSVGPWVISQWCWCYMRWWFFFLTTSLISTDLLFCKWFRLQFGYPLRPHLSRVGKWQDFCGKYNLLYQLQYMIHRPLCGAFNGVVRLLKLWTPFFLIEYRIERGR